MQTACVRHGFDVDHWNHCVADVITVAADIIPAVWINGVNLRLMRESIKDFHECHVMALLSQLAVELAAAEHTPFTLRCLILEREISAIGQ